MKRTDAKAQPTKIYISGENAKLNSRILKKNEGFRQFLNEGQSTYCMPGDSIKIQIKGGNVTGRHHLFVHCLMFAEMS